MKKKEEKIKRDKHGFRYHEVGDITYNGRKVVGVEYPYGEDNYRCYRSTNDKLYLGDMITVVPDYDPLYDLDIAPFEDL